MGPRKRGNAKIRLRNSGKQSLDSSLNDSNENDVDSNASRKDRTARDDAVSRNGKDQASDDHKRKILMLKQKQRRSKQSFFKFHMSSKAKVLLFSLLAYVLATFAKRNFDQFIFRQKADLEVAEMDQKSREMYDYLKNFVCDARDPKTGKKSGYCHPGLIPNVRKRTHSVVNLPDMDVNQPIIGKDEILLILPRHLLITDLDALKDPFVMGELIGAKHNLLPHKNKFVLDMWPLEINLSHFRRENDYRTQIPTENEVDMGAYLAAYLVRRFKLATSGWYDSEKKAFVYGLLGNETIPQMDPLLPFFKILPTYEELKKHHPTLWSQSFLDKEFGEFSNVKQQVYAFRDMIIGEYLALCRKSKEFCRNVSPNEFKAFRINVLSRAFVMGPFSNAISKDEQMDPLIQNLDMAFLKQNNIHLDQGVRAMSPILDMWDHHPKANTAWQYKHKDEAFVVSSINRGLFPGQDVLVSYGKYTDTHLFAKFGFVNGDGSGSNEASLAVYHRNLLSGLEPQFSYKPKNLKENFLYLGEKSDVIKYIEYEDDGFDSCADPDDEVRWPHQVLKFGHMCLTANHRNSWMINVTPRYPHAKSPRNSYTPFSGKNVGKRFLSFNFTAPVEETAKLIALSIKDYEGKAAVKLYDALTERNQLFHVETDKFFAEEVLFRSYAVMSRLGEDAMEQYKNDILEERAFIKKLAETKFQSREWTAANVRLGELETINWLLISTSTNAEMMIEKYKQQYKADIENPDEAKFFFLRPEPCSESTHRLNEGLNLFFNIQEEPL